MKKVNTRESRETSSQELGRLQEHATRFEIYNNKKTLELVLNEPVILASGNLKRVLDLQMCLHQQHYWRNNKKNL